jgi:hypothetical protein
MIAMVCLGVAARGLAQDAPHPVDRDVQVLCELGEKKVEDHDRHETADKALGTSLAHT